MENNTLNKMERGKLKIGLLYLSFHNSIKKVFGVNRIVTKEELMIKLGRQFLVPKRLRICAIKELENMNLIKKEEGSNFKILDYELNVEEDANKFLKVMKIFTII